MPVCLICVQAYAVCMFMSVVVCGSVRMNLCGVGLCVPECIVYTRKFVLIHVAG